MDVLGFSCNQSYFYVLSPTRESYDAPRIQRAKTTPPKVPELRPSLPRPLYISSRMAQIISSPSNVYWVWLWSRPSSLFLIFSPMAPILFSFFLSSCACSPCPQRQTVVKEVRPALRFHLSLRKGAITACPLINRQGALNDGWPLFRESLQVLRLPFWACHWNSHSHVLYVPSGTAAQTRAPFPNPMVGLCRLLSRTDRIHPVFCCRMRLAGCGFVMGFQHRFTHPTSSPSATTTTNTNYYYYCCCHHAAVFSLCALTSLSLYTYIQ